MGFLVGFLKAWITSELIFELSGLNNLCLNGFLVSIDAYLIKFPGRNAKYHLLTRFALWRSLVKMDVVSLIVITLILP